jgi:hypothetical protein
MRSNLQYILSECLKYIANSQEQNGEFKTYLYFPGKPENGWIYAGPSVFITSTIAINLLDIPNTDAKQVCIKAAKYVKTQMESGGLWRFYPHNGLFKFNTPLDIDDTSLASYLLSKEGIVFPDNRSLLLHQVERRKNFQIWFLPRFKLLVKPSYWLRLVFDLRFSWPIFFPMRGRTNAPLIAFSDFEHAVNANVLLYLGKSQQTQSIINHMVEDLLFGSKHNLYFYPNYLFVYYHVSRLYKSGIEDVANTRNMIENYLSSNKELIHSSVFNQATALATLCNFGSKHSLVSELANQIELINIEEIFTNHPYFCTKDRNMLGGSEALTASIVANAISLYLINSK